MPASLPANSVLDATNLESQKLLVIVDDTVDELWNPSSTEAGYGFVYSPDFTRSPNASPSNGPDPRTGCSAGNCEKAEFMLSFIGTSVELSGSYVCSGATCTFLVSIDGGQAQNISIGGPPGALYIADESTLNPQEVTPNRVAAAPSPITIGSVSVSRPVPFVSRRGKAGIDNHTLELLGSGADTHICGNGDDESPFVPKKETVATDPEDCGSDQLSIDGQTAHGSKVALMANILKSYDHIETPRRSLVADLPSLNHTIHFSNAIGVESLEIDCAFISLPLHTLQTSNLELGKFQATFQLPANGTAAASGPVAFMNYSDTRQDDIGFVYQGSWRESADGEYYAGSPVFVPSGSRASFEAAFNGTSLQLLAGRPITNNSSSTINITLDSSPIQSSPNVNLSHPFSYSNKGSESIMSWYWVLFEARDLPQQNGTDSHTINVTIRNMQGDQPFLLGGMLYRPVLSEGVGFHSALPAHDIGKKGLKGGVIAGIVIGVLAFLTFLASLAVYGSRRIRSGSYSRHVIDTHRFSESPETGEQREPAIQTEPDPYRKSYMPPTPCLGNLDATNLKALSSSVDQEQQPGSHATTLLPTASQSEELEGLSVDDGSTDSAMERLNRAMLVMQAQIEELTAQGFERPGENHAARGRRSLSTAPPSYYEG